MQLMPNNLNKMIQNAGMTKREVAALKGITPENLSRQVNGHTNITLQDAEHYAKILDCSPQDVLFPTPPVPIIGYCKVVKCDHDDQTCPAAGAHVHRQISSGKTMGKVYLQSYMQYDTGVVLWSTENGYSGVWDHWDGALEFVEIKPIIENYVSKNAIQHGCYSLLEEPIEQNGVKQQLVHGVLYPEPGNRYTIYNNETEFLLKEQKIIWSAACLDVSFRPKLRGMEIILDD